MSAGRTQTREGARYRRLSRRRGKAKACVAVGNTQMKVYHKLLSSPGMRYEDLGPDYYDNRAGARRQVRALEKRARELDTPWSRPDQLPGDGLTPNLPAAPPPIPRARQQRAANPVRTVNPLRKLRRCCRLPS